MANVKISELTELSKVADEDLLVVVDSSENETKKIKVENFGAGGVDIPISDTEPENPKENDYWLDTSETGTEDVNVYDNVTSNYGVYSTDFINGTVLWTNPDRTAAMEATTATLSESIDNYKYYEIVYFEGNSASSRSRNTGKIPSGSNTRLAYNTSSIYYRNIDISGTTVTIANGNKCSTYGSATADSTVSIPYQIIGYGKVA